MDIFTETPTIAGSGKSNVFFSYDWPLIAKNEDKFFDKFYWGLYG